MRALGIGAACAQLGASPQRSKDAGKLALLQGKLKEDPPKLEFSGGKLGFLGAKLALLQLKLQEDAEKLGFLPKKLKPGAEELEFSAA